MVKLRDHVDMLQEFFESTIKANSEDNNRTDTTIGPANIRTDFAVALMDQENDEFH